VRREFMQRLSAALHGTLSSYLRDALQEGSADAVACLPVPRAWGFSLFSSFVWWLPLLFLVRNFYFFIWGAKKVKSAPGTGTGRSLTSYEEATAVKHHYSTFRLDIKRASVAPYSSLPCAAP
jgi:hypothetical protein